uniref:BTB domain-containing protein n=1 Tax=Trichobilharzia regenti TaxID=157069 RepID=A0AA85KBB1_TRIRE|nr:unnamed protein product [Trichobilharzia regenti]
MDIKQFRDSAELSDFTVYIDNERFKLHKFPLYTKSDFFKEIASSNPVCQISEFPGGSKTFSVIADFCYGKEISVSSQNVVYLYAAADLLKMKGRENMLEISREFIDTIFRNAYETKEISDLICVLCLAYSMKSDAVKKFYDESVEMLLSLWLHEESGFKRLYTGHSKSSSDCGILHDDQFIADYLVYVPLGTIIKLVELARDKRVDEKIILNLCAKYLGRILDHFDAAVQDKGENGKASDAQNLTESKNVEAKETSCTHDHPFCGLSLLVKIDHQKKLEKLYEDNASLSESLKNSLEQFENIFQVLKQPVDLSDFINKTWITKALILTDPNRVKTKCRPDVLKIANKILSALDEEDYDQLSPSVLNDIICANDIKVVKQPVEEITRLSRRSSKQRQSYSTEGNFDSNKSESPNNNNNRRRSSAKEHLEANANESNANPVETRLELPETVRHQIIRYMCRKAEEQKLTMEDYIQFLKKIQMPNSKTSVDDDLVNILKKLTEPGQKLCEEDKKEIINYIKLNNCTADTLNDVLGMDLFPPKAIAEAALYVANQAQGKQICPFAKFRGCSEYPYIGGLSNAYYTKPSSLPMRGRSQYRDNLQCGSHCSRTLYPSYTNTLRSSSLNARPTSDCKDFNCRPQPLLPCYPFQPYSNAGSKYCFDAYSAKYSSPSTTNNSSSNYLRKSFNKDNIPYPETLNNFNDYSSKSLWRQKYLTTSNNLY